MTSIPARRALIVLSALLASACTAGVAPTISAVSSSTAVPASADTVFVASDFWSPKAGTVFELFSVGGGSQPTRLTYCTGCQAVSAAPSLDRNRLVLRRVVADTNADGRLDDSDRVNLVLVDLARGIEGPFLPEGWSTSGADWSSDGSFLVHTSTPDGGSDDIYQIDSNAQNNLRILFTPAVRERGGRLNAQITRVVYERIDGLGPGKSEIWVFASSTNQTKISDSGIVGAQLPGTLYLVGSDAGPDYSPDGASVVFRRLTSTAVTGGAWDILVVTSTGGTPTVIASGPQFRSSPDWSKDGIVFSEQNLTTGGTDIVAVDPSTRARRVLQSFGAGYRAGAPRWIAGISG
jgi:hypothetical protein